MKLLTILMLTLLGTAGQLLAQDYPTCTYTYFKDTKKVATSQCYDAANRFGQARAFARDGHEIYRHGLRRIAGHESVTFQFYPSGAVRQAYMSSAPDAGIQWYHTTTEFSEQGAVTSVINDNHDNQLTSPSFVVPPRPTPVPPVQAQVSQCAALLQAECWFLNRSGRAAQVVARAKTGNEQYLLRLPANGRDTLKSHAYQMIESYQTPAQRYTFAAFKTAKGTALTVSPLPRAYRDLNLNQRRYYFVVY